MARGKEDAEIGEGNSVLIKVHIPFSSEPVVYIPSKLMIY